MRDLCLKQFNTLFLSITMTLGLFPSTTPGTQAASLRLDPSPIQRKVFYVSKTGNNSDGRSWKTAWNELDQIHWKEVTAYGTATLEIDGGNNGMVYHKPLFVNAPGRVEITRSNAPGHSGRVYIDCQNQADSAVAISSGCSIEGLGWRGITIMGFRRAGVYVTAGSASLRGIEIIGASGPVPIPTGGTGPMPIPTGGTGPMPIPTGGTGPMPIPTGGGPVPIPTGGTGPMPIPTGGTGPMPIPTGGTGPMPIPTGGTGPVPIPTGGTGPVPIPTGGTGPMPIPTGGGPVPIPTGGTGPVPIPTGGGPVPIPTGGGPVPIPTTGGPDPMPASNTSTPRSAPISMPMPVPKFADYGVYVQNRAYVDLGGVIIHETENQIVLLPGSSGRVHECWIYNNSYWSRPKLVAGIHAGGANIGAQPSSLHLFNSVIGPGLQNGLFLGHGSSLLAQNCLLLNAAKSNIARASLAKNQISYVTSFMTKLNSAKEGHNCLEAASATGLSLYNSVVYGGNVMLPSSTRLGPANFQYRTTGNTTAISPRHIDPLFQTNVGSFPDNVSTTTLMSTDYSLAPNSPARLKGSQLRSVKQLLSSPF